MTDDIGDSADEAARAEKCRQIREGEIDRQNSRVAINETMCRNPDTSSTVSEHPSSLCELSWSFISGASALDYMLLYLMIASPEMMIAGAQASSVRATRALRISAF